MRSGRAGQARLQIIALSPTFRPPSPELRAALYEAANNLLSGVKRPSPLQAWGKALAAAKGAKRARVAVARKLAILLHRIWQSERESCWA